MPTPPSPTERWRRPGLRAHPGSMSRGPVCPQEFRETSCLHPKSQGALGKRHFLHKYFSVKLMPNRLEGGCPSPSPRFPFLQPPRLPPLHSSCPSSSFPLGQAPLFLLPSSQAEAGQIERSPLFLPWASQLSRDVALGKTSSTQWNKCSAHHHLKGGDS